MAHVVDGYPRSAPAGETVEVTDRGRPVALLVPVPAGSAIEGLESEGRLTAPAGDVLDLGDPLAPEPGVDLPSVAFGEGQGR